MADPHNSAGRVSTGHGRALRPLWSWFNSRAAVTMLGPAILVLLVFTIFPSIYSLLLSLQDWNIESRTSHWVFAGLKYYQRALADARSAGLLGHGGIHHGRRSRRNSLRTPDRALA